MTVCATLMNPESRAALWEQFKKDYEKIQQSFSNRKPLRKQLSIEEARANRFDGFSGEWADYVRQHQTKRVLWNSKMYRLPHYVNLSTGHHSSAFGA